MKKAKRQSEPMPNPETQAAMDDLLDGGQSDPIGNVGVNSPASGTDSSQQPRDRLEAELDEAKNAALRSQAELENFRKRMRREMDDERRYASMPLLRDLLAVLDNMHRAISASEDSNETAGLLEGVKMVSDQFLAVLDQNDCTPIKSVGSPFDPNLHEAIGQESSAEFAANLVSREMRVGYQLHDRVIRPSQVFVSTGPPAADAAGDA